MAPLSRWIILRHQNEASWPLKGHRRAWHACEPVCAAGSRRSATTRVGYPCSTEDAREHAGEHGTHTQVWWRRRAHASSSLQTLKTASCQQLLVLLMRGADMSDTIFIMNEAMRALLFVRSSVKNSSCQHGTTRHTRMGNRCMVREP